MEIKELEVDVDDLWCVIGIQYVVRRECSLLVFIRRPVNLDDQALLALAALTGQESSTSGRLKDLTHTVVGLGRAFEILVGADLLANFLTLVTCQYAISAKLAAA